MHLHPIKKTSAWTSWITRHTASNEDVRRGGQRAAAATLIVLFSTSAIASAPSIGPAVDTLAPTRRLATKMLALDTDFFDAYNQCDLKRFGDYMVPNVEFLHDQGGLMLSRAKVVAATKKYICGKVRRELVPGSLRVYPMKNYGAIAMGEHRFCELATQQCVGSAKFTHVWRERKGKWQMTRILSYDHQPLKP